MRELKVKSIRSGKIYTVYGWDGPFFRLWKGKWVWEPDEFYVPVKED